MAIRASDYVHQDAYDKASQAAGYNESILDSFASAFFDLFKKLVPGQTATSDQVTDFFRAAALPAINAGQVDYGSMQAIARDYTSTQFPSPTDQAYNDSAKNAMAATSAFLSGYAPYASLADKNLTPADAAALISLEQTTEANQLGLTALKRSVNGSTIGDQNGGSMPTGAGAANPTMGKKSGAALILIALAVAYFIFKRK